MKTWLKVSVIGLAFLFSGFAFSQFSQFSHRFDFGVLNTGIVREDRISFAPDRRFNFNRTQLQIPSGYGRLITITASDNLAVFWFESSDGAIRNVVLHATAAVVIDRIGQLDR